MPLTETPAVAAKGKPLIETPAVAAKGMPLTETPASRLSQLQVIAVSSGHCGSLVEYPVSLQMAGNSSSAADVFC
jgi:hypothetical protein